MLLVKKNENASRMTTPPPYFSLSENFARILKSLTCCLRRRKQNVFKATDKNP